MSVSFPYNAAFSGTVSAPLFISNQVLIAPVAAGTASTLTVGSFSATYLSASTSLFASTLTVGTILNFSAGGTVGTNLTLTGSLTAGTVFGVLGSYSNLLASTGILGSITLSGSFTGICNSTPANALDVNGSVYFNQRDISGGSLPLILSSTYTTADSTYGRKIRLSSSYNNGTNTASGFSDIGIARDGTSFFVDFPNTTTQGLTLLGTFCGINAAIPAFTLDVNGTTRVTSLLTNTVDGSTNNSNMFYFAPANLSHIWYLGAGSAGNAFLFNLNGLYPGPDITFNLGTSGQRWKNMFLGGSITMSNGNNVLNGRNIQSGVATATQGAYLTVTFPFAFANVPVVTATHADNYAAPATTYHFSVSCTNITTTSFQLIANYLQSGSSTISQSGNKFNWIAVSPTG